MDNLAHTLVGALLGRAVADRRVPRAAFVGAVAGNLPDLAELVTPRPGGGGFGRVAYLVAHRGVTHSLVGAAVETAVVALVVTLVARRGMQRQRERAAGEAGDAAAARDAAGPRLAWVAACVGLAVLSHLYLDWQGSYGLRPFLPWSGRWYYGDWVAIVDPFFWLVPILALSWGAPRHWGPALVAGTALLGVVALVAWAGHGVVAGWVTLLVIG